MHYDSTKGAIIWSTTTRESAEGTIIWNTPACTTGQVFLLVLYIAADQAQHKKGFPEANVFAVSQN